MQSKVSDFQRQIESEEKHFGVTDPNHFNYPTTAKSILNRCENIKKSISELQGQLQIANSALEEEQAEMRKIELLVQKSGGDISTPSEPKPELPVIGIRI